MKAHFFRFTAVITLTCLLTVFNVGCTKKDTAEQKKLPGHADNPVRIGVVVPSSIEQGSQVMGSIETGLHKAMEELSVKVQYIKPGELPEDEDRLRYLAENQFDLIIIAGNNLSAKLEELAPEYPETVFLDLANDTKGDNIISYRPRTEEFAYLAGVIAGMVTVNNYVAFVGGMEDPAHREEENSFKNGVLAAAATNKKTITLETKYTGFTAKALNQPEKAYELSSTFYEQGADVIYESAGNSGKGVWQAAQERGKVFISSHPVDSAFKGFSLAEAAIKTDAIVFTLVKQFTEKKLNNKQWTFGLKEDALIITLAPSLYPEVRTAVDNAINGIKNGSINVLKNP